jgi:hypothetical protein
MKDLLHIKPLTGTHEERVFLCPFCANACAVATEDGGSGVAHAKPVCDTFKRDTGDEFIARVDRTVTCPRAHVYELGEGVTREDPCPLCALGPVGDGVYDLFAMLAGDTGRLNQRAFATLQRVRNEPDVDDLDEPKVDDDD